MFKKTIIVCSAILFCAFVLAPQVASALDVTPAVREVTLTPGEEKTVLIELENNELDTLQLTTEVVNFDAKAKTGEPIYLEDETPTGAATWVTVNEGPIVIQTGQTSEVAVTFDVPASATPGGHYVGILFNFNQSTAEEADSQLTIESKVATPLLLTVTGNYTESGAIAAFNTVGKKTSYTQGPVEFNVEFKNTGDVHLKPTGNIEITNTFGGKTKTISVNEDSLAVLPDKTRMFEVADWEDLGTSFGKYTATLTIGAGTVSDTASVSFWVFSTTGLIIAIVVVIVIIVVLVLLIKALTKKKPEMPQA